MSEMSDARNAPADYFIAPDADGHLWIWRESGSGDYPVPVVGQRHFRDDPELWDHLTSGLPAVP